MLEDILAEIQFDWCNSAADSEDLAHIQRAFVFENLLILPAEYMVLLSHHNGFMLKGWVFYGTVAFEAGDGSFLPDIFDLNKHYMSSNKEKIMLGTGPLFSLIMFHRTDSLPWQIIDRNGDILYRFEECSELLQYCFNQKIGYPS